jgi:sugar phosphate isomerase/epimerase
MEIGISTWSLHREFESGAIDGMSFPSLCVDKFGIHTLEYVENHLGSTEESYLNQLNEAVRKAGCRIACLAVNNDFSSGDEDFRAEQVEHVKQMLKVAAAIGAEYARVNAGWRSAEDAAEKRVIESVRECLPAAEAAGIKMGLENHGGFTFNPDAVVRIVKGVDSENFGTCPDWGNFTEEDRYSALSKVYAFAVYSHVKSYDFNAEGFETTIDFPKVMEIIRKSGYDGILSIEFEGKGDDYVNVVKTAALLGRLL